MASFPSGTSDHGCRVTLAAWIGNRRVRLAVDEEALERAEQSLGSTREVRQLDEPVGERLVRVSARRAALARSASSSASITCVGSPAISAGSSSRCSAHRRRRVSRTRSASWQTTFISVSLKSECSLRFAEPIVSHAVVDDPDLGVDVHRVAQRSVACVDGAREQTSRAVVCLDQLCEHAAGVVAARVGLRRAGAAGAGSRPRAADEASRAALPRSRATRGTGSPGRSRIRRSQRP